MVVYGVALLSFCMLAGVFLGRLLGYLLGIDANVGGIGIAMLLLIFIANKKNTAIKIDASSKSGINFLECHVHSYCGCNGSKTKCSCRHFGRLDGFDRWSVGGFSEFYCCTSTT